MPEDEDRQASSSENDSSKIDPARHSTRVDETIDISGTDATTQIDAPEKGDSLSEQNDGLDRHLTFGQSKTVVYRGKDRSGHSRDDARSSSDSMLNSTASLDDDGSQGTVQASGSLMGGGDIAATINTRELTPDDAKIWATMVSESSVEQVTGEFVAVETFEGSQNTDVGQEGTKDIPAIDRTVSDRNFDRLRVCDVAQPQGEPKANSDYRLVRKLGQGGMGDVFVARQGSLDRLLALKLIKPIDAKRRQKLMQTGRLEEVEQERRLQFLSEAIVTGDLDHPNIVPIHDVAVTAEGDLFYSMKRVVGTPWSDGIKSMSLDDNIEVLLKVCDAIAQAHTRGVVHRDIKPENVMLGEYGVVMVMDWGLALPTAEYVEKRPSSVLTTTGLGGTPAFMAPEMATGPVAKIGPGADVYLLGATLFMIITGKAPHHASSVTECLHAVRENKIRDVASEHHGELLDIAYHAMATNPADRFAKVTDFQQAIRDYIKHAGSIVQSQLAAQSLSLGVQNHSYEDFSKARHQYEAALQSWNENEPAKNGLEATLVSHAQAALEKEDFDLGLSLLDESRTDHHPLIQQLQSGKSVRASSVKRLQLMKRLAAAMLMFILVGGGVAIYAINQKRQEAMDAKAIAVDQSFLAERQRRLAVEQAVIAKQQTAIAVDERKEATKQREIAEREGLRAMQSAKKEEIAKNDALKEKTAAEESERQADAARGAAEVARADAEEKRNQAIAATQKANYEEYVSKIGLAKARLERNESEVARQILRELKQKSSHANGWEWRWLWRQAGGGGWEVKLGQPVTDFSIYPGQEFGAVLLADDTCKTVEMNPGGSLLVGQSIDMSVENAGKTTSIATSSKPGLIAFGCDNGSIIVRDGIEIREVGSHESSVNDLQFIDDRILVSASEDRSVRVWDVGDSREITAGKACWHGTPVQRLAAVRNQFGLLIAAASSSDTTGRVDLWRVRLVNSAMPERVGFFAGHRRPVSSIALRGDGKIAASGDVDGNVLLWSPSSMKNEDYGAAIDSALRILNQNDSLAGTTHRFGLADSVDFVRLVDEEIVDEEQLVSLKSATNNRQVNVGKAHRDVIQSIAFDTSGDTIVSTSNDYTLKTWSVDKRGLVKKMRGHGGWVTAAAFLGDGATQVVSVSNDQTLRTWIPSAYVGEAVENDLFRISTPIDPSGIPAASAAEGPVAEADSQLESKATGLSTATKAHAIDVSSARFSPDGSRVVTASRDHTARVMAIDPESLVFREVARLESERLQEGTPYVAMSMAVDGLSNHLFVGSADATVRIWDLQRAVQTAELAGTGLNDSIGVSDDGTLVLTGSSSTKTKAILWKVDPDGKNEPEIVHRLRGHDQAVTAFAVSKDGRMLFTGDGIGYGILWNAETGDRIGEPIENVRGFRIGSAVFSADGRSIWIGADDGQLTQVDLANRQNLKRLNHDGAVVKISLAADGRRAVAVSELLTKTKRTSTATLWDLSRDTANTLDRAVAKLDPSVSLGRGNENRIVSASFGNTDSAVFVCRSDDKGQASIKVWKDLSAQSPKTPGLAFALPSRLGIAASVFPLPGGRCLTLNRNAAFLWEIPSGKLAHSYRAHAQLTEAAFSPDGRWIATASRSLKLWDATTGRSLTKVEAPHTGPVRTVDFEPFTGPVNTLGNVQGNTPGNSFAGAYRFATGGDDGLVKIWDWKPGQSPSLLRSIDAAPASRVNAVRFSPDAKRILMACDNGVGRVVELAQSGDKDVVWKLDLPDSNVDFLAGEFSPDGACVAMGGDDDIARLWLITDLKKSRRDPVEFQGHAGVIEGIEVVGDRKRGYRVFTASSDDSVKVWDPMIRSGESEHEGSKLGREVLSLRKHRGDVTAIDMSPDGRVMMTAGKDGQVILWPAEPMDEVAEDLFDALSSP